MHGTTEKVKRFPHWIKKKIITGNAYLNVKSVLTDLKLNTVCDSAKCPNIWECFENSTATFMILGNICTRDCKFCGVKKGKPFLPDENEPDKIAQAVEKLGLKYVVITSVTRDDLEDEGASYFADTIRKIRERNKMLNIEVLLPELNTEKIIRERPDVIGHDIQIVEAKYKEIMPKSSYKKSLDLLKSIKCNSTAIITKSTLMLGIGEKKNEVIKTMKDLRENGCDILIISQYLQPAKENISVSRFISEDEFREYENIGNELGFLKVISGTFFRSSYRAEKIFREIKNAKDPVV